MVEPNELRILCVVSQNTFRRATVGGYWKKIWLAFIVANVTIG